MGNARLFAYAIIHIAFFASGIGFSQVQYFTFLANLSLRILYARSASRYTYPIISDRFEHLETLAEDRLVSLVP